jgi:predicted phage tail protein
MVRDVFLYGPLAETFGAGPHRLYFKGMRDFFAAMSHQFPTFMRELKRYNGMAIMKRDPVKDKFAWVEESHLNMQFGTWPEIHMGVDREGHQVVEAIAAVAAWWSSLSAAATFAIYVGVTIAVVSIMKSMAEVTDNSEANKKADSKSTLFDKPENKTSQGGRVQLLFGTYIASSYTLSQRLRAVRGSIGIEDLLSVQEGSEGRVNLFSNDFMAVSSRVISFSVAGGAPITVDPIVGHGTYTAGNISVPIYTQELVPGVGDTDAYYRTVITYETHPAYVLDIYEGGYVILATQRGSGPSTIPVAVTYAQGLEDAITQGLTLEITELPQVYDYGNGGDPGEGDTGPAGDG